MIELREWFLGVQRNHGNQCAAPELLGRRICGYVYGHPNTKDGTMITTSRIVKANRRFVYTESGSRYWLADPLPEYLEWLASEGIEFDRNDPLKTVPKH